MMTHSIFHKVLSSIVSASFIVLPLPHNAEASGLPIFPLSQSSLTLLPLAIGVRYNADGKQTSLVETDAYKNWVHEQQKKAEREARARAEVAARAAANSNIVYDSNNNRIGQVINGVYVPDGQQAPAAGQLKSPGMYGNIPANILALIPSIAMPVILSGAKNPTPSSMSSVVKNLPLTLNLFIPGLAPVMVNKVPVISYSAKQSPPVTAKYVAPVIKAVGAPAATPFIGKNSPLGTAPKTKEEFQAQLSQLLRLFIPGIAPVSAPGYLSPDSAIPIGLPPGAKVAHYGEDGRLESVTEFKTDKSGDGTVHNRLEVKNYDKNGYLTGTNIHETYKGVNSDYQVDTFIDDKGNSTTHAWGTRRDDSGKKLMARFDETTKSRTEAINGGFRVISETTDNINGLTCTTTETYTGCKYQGGQLVEYNLVTTIVGDRMNFNPATQKYEVQHVNKTDTMRQYAAQVDKDGNLLSYKRDSWSSQAPDKHTTQLYTQSKFDDEHHATQQTIETWEKGTGDDGHVLDNYSVTYRTDIAYNEFGQMTSYNETTYTQERPNDVGAHANDGKNNDDEEVSNQTKQRRALANAMLYGYDLTDMVEGPMFGGWTGDYGGSHKSTGEVKDTICIAGQGEKGGHDGTVAVGTILVVNGQEKKAEKGYLWSAENTSMTHITYDYKGRQTYNVDAHGNDHHVTYDYMGIITSQRDDHDRTVCIQYDDRGNRAYWQGRGEDGLTSHSWATYNSLGQMISCETHVKGDIGSEHINKATRTTFTYDKFGNTTKNEKELWDRSETKWTAGRIVTTVCNAIASVLSATQIFKWLAVIVSFVGTYVGGKMDGKSDKEALRDAAIAAIMTAILCYVPGGTFATITVQNVAKAWVIHTALNTLSYLMQGMSMEDALKAGAIAGLGAVLGQGAAIGLGNIPGIGDFFKAGAGEATKKAISQQIAEKIIMKVVSAEIAKRNDPMAAAMLTGVMQIMVSGIMDKAYGGEFTMNGAQIEVSLLQGMAQGAFAQWVQQMAEDGKINDEWKAFIEGAGGEIINSINYVKLAMCLNSAIENFGTHLKEAIGFGVNKDGETVALEKQGKEPGTKEILDKNGGVATVPIDAQTITSDMMETENQTLSPMAIVSADDGNLLGVLPAGATNADLIRSADGKVLGVSYEKDGKEYISTMAGKQTFTVPKGASNLDLSTNEKGSIVFTYSIGETKTDPQSGVTSHAQMYAQMSDVKGIIHTFQIVPGATDLSVGIDGVVTGKDLAGNAFSYDQNAKLILNYGQDNKGIPIYKTTIHGDRVLAGYAEGVFKGAVSSDKDGTVLVCGANGQIGSKEYKDGSVEYMGAGNNGENVLVKAGEIALFDGHGGITSIIAADNYLKVDESGRIVLDANGMPELNPGGTYLERDTLGRKMLEVITNGDTLVYKAGELDFVKKFGCALIRDETGKVLGSEGLLKNGTYAVYDSKGNMKVLQMENGSVMLWGNDGKAVYIPAPDENTARIKSGNVRLDAAAMKSLLEGKDPMEVLSGYKGYVQIDKANGTIAIRNQYNEAVVNVDLKSLKCTTADGKPMDYSEISGQLSKEQLNALGVAILKAIDKGDVSFPKYGFGGLTTVRDSRMDLENDSKWDGLKNLYSLLKENPALLDYLANVSPKIGEFKKEYDNLKNRETRLTHDEAFNYSDSTYIERLYISITSLPQVSESDLRLMLKNQDKEGIANVSFSDLAAPLFSISADSMNSGEYNADFIFDLRREVVNRMKEYPELFNFGKFQMDDISLNNMTDLYYSSSLESSMLQYYAIQKKEAEIRVSVYESLLGEDKRSDILFNSSLGDNRAYAVIRGFEGDPMAVRAWAEMTEFLLNGEISETGWFRDPLIDQYVNTFDNYDFDVTELKQPFEKEMTLEGVGIKILTDLEKKAWKDYVVKPLAEETIGKGFFTDLIKQYTTLQKGYSYYENIKELDDVQKYSLLTTEERLVLKEFEAGKFAAYGAIGIMFKEAESFLPAGGIPGILASFGLKAVESVIKTTADSGISSLQQDYYNNAVERNLNELQMTPESNSPARTFRDYFREQYINERVAYRMANPEITNSAGYTRQDLVNEETYRFQVYYVQDINRFYQQYFEAYDFNHKNDGSNQ